MIDRTASLRTGSPDIANVASEVTVPQTIRNVFVSIAPSSNTPTTSNSSGSSSYVSPSDPVAVTASAALMSAYDESVVTVPVRSTPVISVTVTFSGSARTLTPPPSDSAAPSPVSSARAEIVPSETHAKSVVTNSAISMRNLAQNNLPLLFMIFSSLTFARTGPSKARTFRASGSDSDPLRYCRQSAFASC